MADLELLCNDTELEGLCLSNCSFTFPSPSPQSEEEREDNLALAFLLVTAAGLSTTFGSAMVYSDRLFSLAKHEMLGAALGFSSGVMLYVSFVEIFQKSVGDFTACNCLWNTLEEDGEEKVAAAAYVMATICFFCGVIVTYGLDVIVHMFFPEGEMEILSQKQVSQAELQVVDGDEIEVGETEPKDAHKLHRMGIMTAAAIALHNFPEGLATFVATLGDPSVGVALAVAIAIHNIPEGLCVAVPVYYATGSRNRAFLLSFFSGVTEIIGALLGYAFLKTVLGLAAYATLFGVVAGMMTTIVVKELLPTGHNYDKKDKYVSNSTFFGMFFMALSLVLFEL